MTMYREDKRSPPKLKNRAKPTPVSAKKSSSRDKKKPNKFVDLSKYDLTNAEVSILFGVTRQTLWHWRNKHRMPYKEIRGFKKTFIRYSYDKVVEWAQMTKTPIVGRSKLRRILAEQMEREDG